MPVSLCYYCFYLGVWEMAEVVMKKYKFSATVNLSEESSINIQVVASANSKKDAENKMLDYIHQRYMEEHRVLSYSFIGFEPDVFVSIE